MKKDTALDLSARAERDARAIADLLADWQQVVAEGGPTQSLTLYPIGSIARQLQQLRVQLEEEV
jgi:hypothetical protein